jgi:hypothetical protein
MPGACLHMENNNERIVLDLTAALTFLRLQPVHLWEGEQDGTNM